MSQLLELGRNGDEEQGRLPIGFIFGNVKTRYKRMIYEIKRNSLRRR